MKIAGAEDASVEMLVVSLCQCDTFYAVDDYLGVKSDILEVIVIDASCQQAGAVVTVFDVYVVKVYAGLI